MAGASAAAGQERAIDPPNEYQVKGAFLFNFAKFISWPAEAFAGPSSPVVIGVLGQDPFGAWLDEIVQGERVNGRDITIRRLGIRESARDCHILFISESERRRLAEILEELDGASVLTVADMSEFTSAGGVIRLTKEDFRIGLEVNLAAADRAKLRISSRLLSLARIVQAPRTAGRTVQP
jgi:hypothetical protein